MIDLRHKAIPLEFVRSRLRVEADGTLVWLPRIETTKYHKAWNTINAGKPAGRINSGGYSVITLTYENYAYRIRCHRVVWLLTHGNWPTQCIDHINRIRTDNRPENLRDVSLAENSRNTIRWGAKKSGAKRRGSRFIAQYMLHGRRFYLGTFDTEAEAGEVYRAAIAKLNESHV